MIIMLLMNTQMIWMMNIEEYNLNKKRKILFVFDDVINDMLNKKRLIQ